MTEVSGDELEFNWSVLRFSVNVNRSAFQFPERDRLCAVSYVLDSVMEPIRQIGTIRLNIILCDGMSRTNTEEVVWQPMFKQVKHILRNLDGAKTAYTEPCRCPT